MSLTLHAGQIVSNSARTSLKTSSPPLLAAEFRTVLLSLKISSAEAAVEADTRFLTWQCLASGLCWSVDVERVCSRLTQVCSAWKHSRNEKRTLVQ